MELVFPSSLLSWSVEESGELLMMRINCEYPCRRTVHHHRGLPYYNCLSEGPMSKWAKGWCTISKQCHNCWRNYVAAMMYSGSSTVNYLVAGMVRGEQEEVMERCARFLKLFHKENDETITVLLGSTWKSKVWQYCSGDVVWVPMVAGVLLGVESVCTDLSNIRHI